MVNKLLIAIVILLTVLSPANADLIRIETNTNLKAVYLIQDTDSDQILVNPVFFAGEVDFSGPQGLSHYLEHLMFWHADKVAGKDYHGRDGNAWVNGIVTSYYNQGILSEITDLFGFAKRLLELPMLDEKFMLDEKRVVEREYDLRVSQNSHRKMYEHMQRKLYSPSALARSVIGTPQSIRALPLKNAFDFHNQYYHPANMVLLVSGNLTPQQVRELVENNFSGINPGAKNPQQWRDAKPESAQHQIQKRKFTNLGSNAYKYFGLSKWNGTGDPLQDYYTVVLATKLLNSALAGSLAKPLRLDNFFASQLYATLDPLLNGHIQFVFNAQPDENIDLDNLEGKFKSALNALAESGAPAASIERVRKRLLREATRRSTNSEFLLQRSFQLLRLDLEPNNSADNLQRLNAITKHQIDALLHAIANPIRSVDGYMIKETQ